MWIERNFVDAKLGPDHLHIALKGLPCLGRIVPVRGLWVHSGVDLSVLSTGNLLRDKAVTSRRTKELASGRGTGSFGAVPIGGVVAKCLLDFGARLPHLLQLGSGEQGL